MRFLQVSLIGAAFLAASFGFVEPLKAGPEKTGFNDEGIVWHDLEDGLSLARAEEKPVYLLVHATWCPTCRQFQKVFFAPSIEALSKEVVFVLVDRDKSPRTSLAYAPDGNYIPRSMILTAAGELREELTSGNPDYRYFLPAFSHKPLAAFLSSALSK